MLKLFSLNKEKVKEHRSSSVILYTIKIINFIRNICTKWTILKGVYGLWPIPGASKGYIVCTDHLECCTLASTSNTKRQCSIM